MGESRGAMRARPTEVRNEVNVPLRSRAPSLEEQGDAVGPSSRGDDTGPFYSLPPFPGSEHVLTIVERWRYYRLHPAQIGYDLSDPLQRSIWTATQLYVNHLETLALSRGLDLYTLTRAEIQELLPIEAWDLESSLWRLRDLVAEEEIDRHALMRLLVKISTALFGPSRTPYSLYMPREFWDSAATDVAIQTACPGQPQPALAPLAGLFRRALKLAGGELINQAEAARRLGLTPRSVSLRIQAGRLEAIRVGGTVLVFAETLAGSSSEA